MRIGTRGSRLARWQADRVRALLASRGVACEIVTIRTSGDIGAPRRAGLAVKGLFTKEIEDALLAGRIQLAVHSLKDLLIALPPGLTLAAFPEREDPRDALVTRDGRSLAQLPAGARLGTSSLRRAAAVRAARPDVELVDLRGNVPTRVAAVGAGRVDGAVMALAGLARLGLAGGAVPLDPAVVLPAPGQGAIAVEARADDAATLEVAAAVDDPTVRVAVEAERAALGLLETGCNVPIGALCRAEGAGLMLQVTVYALDGREQLVARVAVDPADPHASGRSAARQLLERGARRLIEEATRAAQGRGG